MIKKPLIYVGIDPGTHTGICVWNTATKMMVQIKTVAIHQAMSIIKDQWERNPDDVRIRFEDARKRVWFGKKSEDQHKAEQQGAGSIKRDCTIWEDYLKDNAIPYEAVHPKRIKTKIDAETFGKITGYKKLTSNHARDAAMLVYGL